MLFSSPEFIFVFLPITVVIYYQLRRSDSQGALYFLLIASLAFYGWWRASGIFLILGSTIVNFYVSRHVSDEGAASRQQRRTYLRFGIAFNLLLLFYFKYLAFAIATVNGLLGSHILAAKGTLPLGISFFTFTQIAFLVDVYRSETREDRAGNYALFVSFFPHLIAGPIVHHRQVMPQFKARRGPRDFDLSVGLMLFSIGLAKKVIIADRLSPYANVIFDHAGQGLDISLVEAWAGALTYTFQIYFDFSGYSDMAIGLARMFGIRFPANFDSPYKATSVVDFWRRWHMTLSQFLRDYLYIPLGGNRRGPVRRYLNVFVTMLLGGLWHGANWTFIAWGAMHGVMIVINQFARSAFGPPSPSRFPVWRLGGSVCTFVAVVVAWVLFRASDIHTAARVIATMFGLNGIDVPAMPASLTSLLDHLPVARRFDGLLPNHLFPAADLAPWLVIAAGLAFLMPNSQTIVGRFRPVLGSSDAPPDKRWAWRPTAMWGVVNGLLFTLTMISFLYSLKSDFIYYNF